MYKVYLDNQLMYRPGYDNLSLAAAKLKQEINKSGTFTYTIYPNNTCCGLENKMKSIVLVYDDDELLFRGRVLNSEEGFYNEKTVTCEGELSFLIDSIQRPHEFSGTPAEYFIYLITNHNSQVDEWKQFKIGYITVTDPNDYIARSDSTYMNTKDTIDQKLVDLCGGYVVTRYVNDEVYIDYLAELINVNEQSVEFAKNLLDLNKSVKGEDVATAVIPLGAQSDDGNRLTIASVNDGVDYVYNASAVEEFGWIFKTVTYDDVTIASNLLAKGQADLESLRFLAQTLEVSAADLNGVSKDIAAFRVGKWTNVISKLHNLEKQYLTQSRTINLLDPTDSTLMLGGEITGLTDIVNSSISVTDAVTNIINTATGTVYAEKIMGVINLMNTSLSAQKDAAQTADVVAILFQDLDPDSAMYGAMAIGTQGIQIAKERNELGTDWNWGTAVDFQTVYADYVTAGILADKTGRNYWNLDTGEFVSKKGKIGNWTIEELSIQTGNYNTSGTMYFGSNGLSLGTAFRVTNTGALNATGVAINGKLTAEGGEDGVVIQNGAVCLYDVSTDEVAGYFRTGIYDSVHKLPTLIYSNDIGVAFVDDDTSSANTLIGTNVLESSSSATYRSIYTANSLETGSAVYAKKYCYYAAGGSGVWYQHGLISSSDRSLKENIEPAGEALDLLNQIEIVKFDWKDSVQEKDDHEEFGVIANDLENIVVGSVFDSVSYKNGEEVTIKAVDTLNLLCFAIKCIQEQKTIIENLEERITSIGG